MEYFLVVVALLSGLIGYAWGYYDGRLKERETLIKSLEELDEALKKRKQGEKEKAEAHERTSYKWN